MSRSLWSHVYALAAIGVAAAASIWSVAGRSCSSIDDLLFFALLIAVAIYLREDDAPSTAGFEAAVVFAAVPLLHDPAVALVSVFVGAAIHNLFRRIALSSLLDAAQL